MDLSLIIPAFIAGLLTFLAPCTLPLVPAYLAFIAGSSAKEHGKGAPSHIMRHAVSYVLGFSIVFVILGMIFGLLGIVFAPYRIYVAKAGAVLIVFFGLYLMHVFDNKFTATFFRERRLFKLPLLTPGTSKSSFLLGATFAAGWTPCVGPILGSILLLASNHATVLGGGVLLSVFSFGLGVPFLILAFFLNHANAWVSQLKKVLPYISFIGGAFLLVIGVLMLTDTFAHWSAFVYRLFSWIGYDSLLDHL